MPVKPENKARYPKDWPENVERSNLRSMRQRCHLAYDSRHHAVNAAKTRHRGRAARDFFEESP